jgi:XRE family transcriptional regulator, aerobic/anaerobic benzoate catabolism transcriptional regulator
MIRVNFDMHYMSGMQASMAKPAPAPFKGSLEIAQRIRSARARAGLTRKQLATAARASERYLATLEAGKGNPSAEMLLAIAEALNIALAELLPMGGERDFAVSQAAAQLRRLPPEGVREMLTWLGGPGQRKGEKAGRIALIGLRGAGKSSLGQALAQRMNVPFFEISKEVERRYGGSIAVMMELNGPGTLQRLEAEVLEEILSSNPAAIIAAPGAIVSAAGIYERLLQSAWTVWLQASPEDHMARVVAQGDLRPMAGNRAAMNDLKSILAAREADYARADMRLDTSAQDFAATLNLLETITTSQT